MNLEEALATIGPQLARQALTHPSREAACHYQRLEFLGDAVLGAVISAWLYDNCPDHDEGRMSWLKAWLVREETLASIANDLDLDKHITLGTGAENAGDQKRPSILADVLEAVIGALFVSGGWNQAEAAVEQWFGPYLSRAKHNKVSRDSKSLLQERLQQQGKGFHYLLKDQQGPDHEKLFWVELWIEGKPVAVGQGKSKKEAEQKAAAQALKDGI